MIMDERSSMKTFRRWRCSEPGCKRRALGKDLAETSRHVVQHMTTRFHCADRCGRLYCHNHRNPSCHSCNPATEARKRVAKGDAVAVARLMDVDGFEGFDVNQDGPEAALSEEPMLCLAAGRGYDGVVELLLQHPYIEVNVRTPIKCGGLSALHLAVRERAGEGAAPAPPPRHSVPSH